MSYLTRSFRLFLLGLCLLPAAVVGLPVAGLYSYEVAVESQNDSERNRAFRAALEAVLLKVTGEQRWLENPVLQQALDDAQNYVEAINPRTETRLVTDVDSAQAGDVDQIAVPAITQIQQNYINVVFARALIDRLLTNAAIPVWGSNRPSVLVWMALQNDVGERTLLSAESNPEIINFMRQFATERGLPIIFPVLDFEDRQNINADMIWSLDEQAIKAASYRYGADSVLSGRLHFTASGDLVGLWQFMFQDQVEVFDSFDTDLQNYINEPLDRITNQLASHFSIVASLTGNQKVKLRVEGVNDLSAYSALLSYLQNLVLVEKVAISKLRGEDLELDLTLKGDQSQLNELIALDRDLMPLNTQAGETQSVLSYRWMR